MLGSLLSFLILFHETLSLFYRLFRPLLGLAWDYRIERRIAITLGYCNSHRTTALSCGLRGVLLAVGPPCTTDVARVTRLLAWRSMLKPREYPFSARLGFARGWLWDSAIYWFACSSGRAGWRLAIGLGLNALYASIVWVSFLWSLIQTMPRQTS